MAGITITLPSAGDGSLNEYGYVLLMAFWIAFQCYMTGFVVVEYKRAKTYTQEFLDKNFLEEHQKAFPNEKKVPKFGYPDMGNGWYSQKLTYKQWFEFNLAQRVHYNFIENCIIIVFLILIAGIRHTSYSVIAGGCFSFGRILYSIGYSKTVKGRVPGFIFGFLTQLILFGLATHSAWGLLADAKITA